MVTFRYHFLLFLLFTTGFFDLEYICMGFILSEGKKRCLVVFRYHFGTIRLDYFNCPNKIRIISLLFHSLSCHESSFLLSPVTSVTPQMEEPASFPEFFFCAAFHFSVGANICQIGRSSRVWGIEIPGKSSTQEYTIVYYEVDLALRNSKQDHDPKGKAKSIT